MNENLNHTNNLTLVMTHGKGSKRKRLDTPHHKSYDFVCAAPECEFRTSERIAVQMHRKLIHGSVVEVEDGESDTVSLLKKPELLMDMNQLIDTPNIPTFTHDGKYICLTCGLVTPRKTCFDIHIRAHIGEKPFSCKFCAYRAHSKQLVNAHERMHTGQCL